MGADFTKYEPDPPKGVERLHNLTGATTDPSILFALVDVLEQIDRLSLFVYGNLIFTNDRKNTVCANQLWQRYKAWSARDPEPLPEKMLCERLVAEGWFYNEVTHQIDCAVWRDNERLLDEQHDWSKHERERLNFLQRKYRHAVSDCRWGNASKHWVEITELKQKLKRRAAK